MKMKANEDFRIIKPDPLQQPTAVGPGGPRATRGAQPEPPAGGRGASRRLLSFSGRHMRPAGLEHTRDMEFEGADGRIFFCSTVRSGSGSQS